MIRVVVESPHAPRTPLPEGQCVLAARGFGECGPWSTPMCDEGYNCYNLCPRCTTLAVRAAESQQHARYLAACLRDCLLRGEAPFASHGLYTLDGVLRDEVPEERAQGIAAGFVWREVAHVSAFYIDLGWSSGMKHGEEDARKLRTTSIEKYQVGIDVSDHERLHRLAYRTLGPDWDRK